MNKIRADWFHENISLNKVQIRNIICKWSSKSMTKPKVQNLWNNLAESYSPKIFFVYSTRTVVKCPSINFCFEFLERSRIFCEFGRRSHHLLPNVSKSNGNESVKFGQLIKYSLRIIFQKSCRQWGRETSSRPLCFLKKAFYEVKAIGQHRSFNIFW